MYILKLQTLLFFLNLLGSIYVRKNFRNVRQKATSLGDAVEAHLSPPVHDSGAEWKLIYNVCCQDY